MQTLGCAWLCVRVGLHNPIIFSWRFFFSSWVPPATQQGLSFFSSWIPPATQQGSSILALGKASCRWYCLASGSPGSFQPFVGSLAKDHHTQSPGLPSLCLTSSQIPGASARPPLAASPCCCSENAPQSRKLACLWGHPCVSQLWRVTALSCSQSSPWKQLSHLFCSFF